MTRYLIEVEHEGTTASCARAIGLFLQTGSHFLANADWGCKDGTHKAWVVIDAEDRDQALGVVPPEYRPKSMVVQLTSFTMNDVEDMLRDHAS
jgi:hypothetical protein